MDPHFVTHPETHRDGGHLQDESVTELVREASTELEHLIRSEMAIAKRELRQSARAVVRSSIYFGIGAVVGLVGFMALTACAIAAIALGLPLWLSAIIIGGAWVLIGIGAVAVGYQKLRAVDAPQLKHHLQEDQQWLKTTAERMKTSRANAHA